MQLQHVGTHVFGGSLTDLAQIQASATADVTKVGNKVDHQVKGPLEDTKVTMKDTGAVPNRATKPFEDDTAKKLANKKARLKNANK
jgi:hypothetical protein